MIWKKNLTKTCGQGNVRSGKCLSGEMSSRGSVLRGSVRSGNSPFGEMSLREVSVGELSSRKCQSGNCPPALISVCSCLLKQISSTATATLWKFLFSNIQSFSDDLSNRVQYSWQTKQIIFFKLSWKAPYSIKCYVDTLVLEGTTTLVYNGRKENWCYSR